MQKKGIQVIINRNLAEKHFGERRIIRYQVTDCLLYTSSCNEEGESLVEKRWIAYPYHIWMAIFTVVPLALIVFYAFTLPNEFTFSLENIKRVMEPLYLEVLLRSIYLALVSTVICFIIGYPMALILSETSIKYRNMLVLMVVIPMWMNFLLRTYAWMTLLERKGLINSILTNLHLPTINILYTDYAAVSYTHLKETVEKIREFTGMINSSVNETVDKGAATLEIVSQQTSAIESVANELIKLSETAAALYNLAHEK